MFSKLGLKSNWPLPHAYNPSSCVCLCVRVGVNSTIHKECCCHSPVVHTTKSSRKQIRRAEIMRGSKQSPPCWKMYCLCQLKTISFLRHIKGIRENILGNQFMEGVVKLSLSQGLTGVSSPFKNWIPGIWIIFPFLKKDTAGFLKTKEIINNSNSQFYSDYLPSVLLVPVALFH